MIDRRTFLGLLPACALAPALAGEDRSHGRSMVIHRYGIAATSHTLASQVGAQILARGGSAVDAAIACNATLGVTEPMMNGVGGDVFMIYREAKTGKLWGLNGSGWAPKALTADGLRRQGHKEMPASGIHSVTTPGCVDGWYRAHQKFGKLPWKDLFGAAIRYAEEGYPVPEMIQAAWANDRLKVTPESQRVFLPGGAAPRVGDVFRNPDLGRTMQQIAAGGPEAFYQGPIARAILKTSDALGGTMTADDLRQYQSEWVEPISVDYRGWRVWELPPNGQGMAALMMLNIMAQFDPAPGGPFGAEEIHKRIEAMKLAYSDLYAFVGDPRHVKVPMQGLLSSEYAKKRAALISRTKANCEVKNGDPVRGDTTYLAVVDREGNVASWIQSISAAWGSGVVPDGLGFQLHNRGGSGFSLDPKRPNALEGRRRPFHTIIPGFLQKGDAHIGFGIMGGPNQPLAHAQFVSNFVDYGMNLQAAMEAPRFTKVKAEGCEVLVESRATLPALQELSARGHVVEIRGEYTLKMGRGQAVMHDASKKVNYAGSDPRTDGSAEPEPIA